MELIVLCLLAIGIVTVILINLCSKLESRVDTLEDVIQCMQERDDYK
jgi:hypothetical protein